MCTELSFAYPERSQPVFEALVHYYCCDACRQAECQQPPGAARVSCATLWATHAGRCDWVTMSACLKPCAYA